MVFKPNSLREEDIKGLEDWQLLVAACHFGPRMGDCVELDYGYRVDDDGTIYCVGSGHAGRDVSLAGDIDQSSPQQALEQYAGIDWREAARHKLLLSLGDV